MDRSPGKKKAKEPTNPKTVVRSETDADVGAITDADVGAITEVTVAAFKTLEIGNHTEQFIMHERSDLLCRHLADKV